ncbi:ArsB/NhaD family transporter [Paenibacillus eucommiae]|uniref:Na+/H+ antiporter NhaD/arsenite permease-like protein n=1 Tax=Paenibacillus eucommiae TaxID=1355755 RepID=A0ABS4IMZ2_9BACL|nr:ArsB/NhaD family transporter [Paenibacillus eucommiae]MBP1988938.1 Na+/H+ antiporter NhaD/arsenite permease-like protein [Paenibacillus eucommiae]
MLQTWLALIIFLVVYAIIISEKINRTLIALIGAALLIILGITDLQLAFTQYIEWRTITLLAGMMILGGFIQQTGLFQYAAVRTAKAAKGHPLRILIFLSILAAVASTVLDNITTILLVVPITLSITRIIQVNPVPFLLAEIIASNIGGTASLIGNPLNMMIGTANPHLTFNAFILNLAPIVVIILAAALIFLYLVYKKQLKPDPKIQAKLLTIKEREFIQDPSLIKKSVIVLALTLLAFIFHTFIQVEPAAIAIAGAILLMLIGTKRQSAHKAFEHVDWAALLFFVGLFALVGGLQEVGIIRNLAQKALEITQGDMEYASILMLWGSAFASATVDNIPFVVTMIPFIKEMADGLGLAVDSSQITTLWWSLALGSCLGGNATMIGASANLIAAGMAAKEGKSFSYWEFLKVGAPITLISLVIAQVYVYLRYFI